MDTGSFPGVKCGRSVLLTTHPLLVPWSWKSRAIPLTDPLGHTGPVTGSLLLNSFIVRPIWRYNEQHTVHPQFQFTKPSYCARELYQNHKGRNNIDRRISKGTLTERTIQSFKRIQLILCTRNDYEYPLFTTNIDTGQIRSSFDY